MVARVVHVDTRLVMMVAGLPASEDFNVKVYLDKNEDIRQRYGDQAYAAALNHFIEWGHKQTWRENGGSTCKYCTSRSSWR